MLITLFKIKGTDEIEDYADGNNFYERVGCDTIVIEMNDDTFDTLQTKHKEKKVKWKNNQLEFEV